MSINCILSQLSNKKKLLKTAIIQTLLFGLLYIIAFRKLIFFPGNIGHNWDWSFPAVNLLYKNFSDVSRFTWISFGLGTPIDLNLSHLLPNIIISLIGNYLGPKFLTLFFIFFTCSVSYISSKKALDYLIGNNKLHNIIALIYSYSPFLFNDFIGGSWPMWLSYAFAPLYFKHTINFLHHNNPHSRLQVVILSIPIIVSLQHYFLINLIAVTYIMIIRNGQKIINIIYRLSIIALLIIFANLYWIVPFVLRFNDFASINFDPDIIQSEQTQIQASKQNLFNILNLAGYLDRNLYLHALSQFLFPVYLFTILFSWILIFITLIKSQSKKYIQPVSFWILLLFSLTIIIKGANPPFSEITVDIYKNFSFLKLFRSPQHLMFIPAFIYPILISYTFYYWNNKFRSRLISLILLISTLIITSGFWSTGDLGMKNLSNKNLDHVDLYHLPPKLENFYRQSESDQLYYRTLFLPSVFSPEFQETEYQESAQGCQPEYFNLKKPTLIPENEILVDNLELLFCNIDQKNFDLIKYTSIFSIRYIVLRSDIYPKFSQSKTCWNVEEVQRLLDSDNRLNLIDQDKYTRIYQIKDDYFIPVINIPRTVIFSEYIDNKNIYQIIDSSIKQNTVYPFVVLNLDTKKHLDVSNKGDQNVKIEYLKINPTKYIVRIYQADSQFILNFLERYNHNWQIFFQTHYSIKSDDFISKEYFTVIQNNNLSVSNFLLTWLSKPIDAIHFQTNSYANGWIIDPHTICQKNKCLENNDSSKSFDLIIEYKFQKYFYLSLFLSLIFISYLIISHRKTNE